MRLHFLFSYQARWGTEENRGPPLVLGPSPPDFPHCSLKGAESWEKSYQLKQCIDDSPTAAHCPHHVRTHWPSENARWGWIKDIHPGCDIWASTFKGLAYIMWFVEATCVIMGVHETSLQKRENIVSEKKDDNAEKPMIHCCPLACSAAQCVRLNGWGPVWRRVLLFRPVQNSAPLIFSFTSALWPQTCGHQKIPPLLKRINIAALLVVHQVS